MCKIVFFLLFSLVVVLVLVVVFVMVQFKGDWMIGVGVYQVVLKLNNGVLVGGMLKVDVDNDIKLIIIGEYFIVDNLGIEVLVVLLFKYDINIVGFGCVGSIKYLLLVVLLQYYFNSKGKVLLFVGVGLNYIIFFSEEIGGVLVGSLLKLDDFWGLVVYVGVDFVVSDKGLLCVDVCWIDIDIGVKFDGEKIGIVNIDLLVYGVFYVFKF